MMHIPLKSCVIRTLFVVVSLKFLLFKDSYCYGHASHLPPGVLSLDLKKNVINTFPQLLVHEMNLREIPLPLADNTHLTDNDNVCSQALDMSLGSVLISL